MIAKNGIRNPYPGPRPFEQEERDLFFGREREVNELLSRIIAHQVVVLYAQSGAGKTSVLNAGIIPLLIEENFEVLPVARVRGFEPEGMDLSRIANIYVFNTLVGWSEDNAEPASLIHLSIKSFLKEREHLKDEFEDSLPRLAIFDQFEELFTFYPERWREREDFFHQVVDALEADPLLRVLFVMREDYLAGLDSYSRLFPEQLRNRSRLERLRQEAAIVAVEKPLRGTGRSFAEGVASSLVRELLSVHVEDAQGETIHVSGEYVEPVQLQVVCQNLWESLPEDVTVITHQHLQTFGDVEEALKGFYERTLEIVQRGTGVEEGELREWFDKELITPAGTRGTVFRGKERTGRIPNSAVDALADQHIVRSEIRAGGRWYELTHDRLIDPVRKSNEVWFQLRREEEQQREVEVERQRAEEQQRRAEEQARIASKLRRLIVALIIVSLVAIGAAVAAFMQFGTARSQRQLAQEQTRIAMGRQAEAAKQREKAEAAAREAEHRRVEAEQAKTAEAEQREKAEAAAREAEQRQKEAEQAKTAEAEQREKAETAAREAEQRRVEAEQAKTAEAEQREKAETAAREAEQRQKEAEQAKAEAVEQRQIVLARNLATQADLARNLPAELRILLAVESVLRLPSSFENVQVLRERLAESADAAAVRMIHQSYVYSVVFSPDGRYLATIGNDKIARVWKVSDGQQLSNMNHEGDLNSVAFSPDGRYLATACEDGSVRVWEVSSGQEVSRVDHESGVNFVAFSPDGEHLATAVSDGTARLWMMSNGQKMFEMSHGADVISAVFSPDGEYLATADDDGIVRIWKASTGNEIDRIAHKDRVNSICFSPDGRYLAIADDSRIVHVWDISSHREVAYMIHDSSVYSVAFSPDGRHLATASKDTTARIWEMSSGRQVARMNHQDEVYSVCFSPDGGYLATASKDKTAIIWPLLPDDLVAKARFYVNRNFTQEEWRKYLGDEEPYRRTWPDLPGPDE